MIYTLENIKEELIYDCNPIIKSRVFGGNNSNQYELYYDITFELSNKKIITIPKKYMWDLASVPRVFWALIPPDSDAETAFLIHDFLYENKIENRKFADKELLKWSVATNGTNNWSLRNIDNYIRYYVVRLFGWIVWNKKKN